MSFLAKEKRSATITGLVLGLVVVCALVITSLVVYHNTQSEKANQAAEHPLRKADVASGSDFTDNAGNRVVLTNLAEEWTLITTWATWCPSCRAHLDYLSAIQTSYYDDGVRVIAFNRSEPRSTIAAYREVVNLPGNIRYINDATDVINQTLEGYAMPETILVSPAGDVVAHFRGSIANGELEAVLETHLSRES